MLSNSKGRMGDLEIKDHTQSVRKPGSKIRRAKQSIAVHAFNPSTWEAKVDRSVSSKSARSTELVPARPGLLHREILSLKRRSRRRKKKRKKRRRRRKRKKNPFYSRCFPDRVPRRGVHYLMRVVLQNSLRQWIQ